MWSEQLSMLSLISGAPLTHVPRTDAEEEHAGTAKPTPMGSVQLMVAAADDDDVEKKSNPRMATAKTNPAAIIANGSAYPPRRRLVIISIFSIEEVGKSS